MNSIMMNKFNGNAIDYTIHKDLDMVYICVFNKIYKEIILYDQTYKIVKDYCGDIYFTPLEKEYPFKDGTNFTRKELKILLDYECEYPDVNSYDLDILFNFEF